MIRNVYACGNLTVVQNMTKLNIQHSGLISTSRMSSQFSEDLEKINDVRELLIETGNPNIKNGMGEPAWFIALKNKNFIGAAELINSGADINILNRNHESWLISCLDYEADNSLFTLGFQQADNTWAESTADERHPFFHPNMTPYIASRISTKWWSERKSWDKLKVNNLYPEDVFLNHNKEVGRIFNFWHQRCLFFK